MRDARATPADEGALLAELIERGLLIESGVPGVYGHGAAFEHARAAVGALLSAEAAALGAEVLRFPPVLPRRVLEQAGYLGSFPHLVGSVYAFDGDESQAAVQAERAARHEDRGEFQSMTELALVPAACYPIYPAIAARGPLPEEGAFVDTGGSWAFRSEPSHDPGRHQTFHQHEMVRVGDPDVVAQWREDWAKRGLELLRSLGLAAELVRASDPFFGRRGRMLAASQREQALKLELTVHIAGPSPTALASFNQHREYFGVTFGIELAGGEPAHTACLGFGHERIVIALMQQHGFDPERWPDEVRVRLRL